VIAAVVVVVIVVVVLAVVDVVVIRLSCKNYGWLKIARMTSIINGS
jgi:hypothetical protein